MRSGVHFYGVSYIGFPTTGNVTVFNQPVTSVYTRLVFNLVLSNLLFSLRKYIRFVYETGFNYLYGLHHARNTIFSIAPSLQCGDSKNVGLGFSPWPFTLWLKPFPLFVNSALKGRSYWFCLFIVSALKG